MVYEGLMQQAVGGVETTDGGYCEHKRWLSYGPKQVCVTGERFALHRWLGMACSVGCCSVRSMDVHEVKLRVL